MSFMNFLKNSALFRAFQNTFGANANAPKHKLDQMLKSMLSDKNLSAPPIDKPMAYKILNIEPKQGQIDPKHILDRYYVLYKKNDPVNGGTPYLQSKILVAKEALMSEVANATQFQQDFYKQFIEPKQKEQEEERKKKQDEEKAEKESKQKNNKQEQQKK